MRDQQNNLIVLDVQLNGNKMNKKLEQESLTNKIKAVLKKRARNSSLGFDSVKIVSGERPRFFQPFHAGSKSNQGINNP